MWDGVREKERERERETKKFTADDRHERNLGFFSRPPRVSGWGGRGATARPAAMRSASVAAARAGLYEKKEGGHCSAEYNAVATAEGQGSEFNDLTFRGPLEDTQYVCKRRGSARIDDEAAGWVLMQGRRGCALLLVSPARPTHSLTDLMQPAGKKEEKWARKRERVEKLGTVRVWI